MRFTNSILIRQPVDKTFSFVSNFSNIPKWNYSVISCAKVSEGLTEAGSVFKQQRRFLGKILEDTFAITSYETDKTVSITSIEAAYPFAVTYSFGPNGQNTLLVNQFELKAKRLMRFFEFVLRPNVKRAVAVNLDQLKKLMETGQ